MPGAFLKVVSVSGFAVVLDIDTKIIHYIEPILVGALGENNLESIGCGDQPNDG